MLGDSTTDVVMEKPEASTAEEFLDNPDNFSLKPEFLNSYIEVS